MAETDYRGEIRRVWREDLPFEGRSAGQRKALLSDALTRVFAEAGRLHKPVVIEDLDFTQKKKQLAALSPAQARVLSGLAYSQYQQLALSKGARLGIELIKVNPSYTSTIGRVKYAAARGRTVHQAAAGAIARRGQRLVEKLPGRDQIKVPVGGKTREFSLPVRNRAELNGVAWRKLHQTLTTFLRRDYLATRGTPSAPSRAKGRSSVKATSPVEGGAPRASPGYNRSLLVSRFVRGFKSGVALRVKVRSVVLISPKSTTWLPKVSCIVQLLKRGCLR